MSKKAFTQRWVANLVACMDAHLDEETRVALMESCGRACARGGAVSAAQGCKGDLDKLLATLSKWVGGENVRRDGDEVRVTYTKCYCHLVQDGPERLPDTYCYCSRGWLKEMFETVVGEPVEVDVLETVKRGGQACRFVVRL